MPNNSSSMNTPEKQPLRASEEAAMIADGAHEIVGAATETFAPRALSKFDS